MTSLRYIRPARDRFIVEQLSDGSMAVFDRTGDAVHSLNPTAAAVWAGCAEPASVDDLCDALAEGTATLPGGEAIEAAVRQLLDAGLLQEVRDASPALPLAALSSRRQALKRIATGAAVALPVVLTLAGKEQRLLAQGCGSPLVNLTGCWTGGTEGDDDDLILNLTQAGNTLTGTATSEDGLSANVTGTICGTTLDLLLVGTLQGVCGVTITMHATGVTSNAFSAAVVGDFADSPSCQDLQGLHFEDTITFTKGCAPS